MFPDYKSNVRYSDPRYWISESSYSDASVIHMLAIQIPTVLIINFNFFYQTPDPKTRRSLAKFVRQKHESFVEQPKNPFPCILEIFGQFDLHKIDKKRRIALVKVETEVKVENGESAPSSSSKENIDTSQNMSLSDKQKLNIGKLEKALMQCQQAIEKLETEDMDLVNVYSRNLNNRIVHLMQI